jgi:hypothetical protein
MVETHLASQRDVVPIKRFHGLHGDRTLQRRRMSDSSRLRENVDCHASTARFPWR